VVACASAGGQSDYLHPVQAHGLTRARSANPTKGQAASFLPAVGREERDHAGDFLRERLLDVVKHEELHFHLRLLQEDGQQSYPEACHEEHPSHGRGRAQQKHRRGNEGGRAGSCLEAPTPC
jgi:hypothetical protein